MLPSTRPHKRSPVLGSTISATSLMIWESSVVVVVVLPVVPVVLSFPVSFLIAALTVMPEAVVPLVVVVVLLMRFFTSSSTP